MQTIQTRGAAVIAARKMSSAMSAAKAAGDHMKSIWQGTAAGEWVSMGVVSDGSYGVPADVVYSFPVTIKDKKWTIVQVTPCLQTMHFFGKFVGCLFCSSVSSLSGSCH